VLEQRDVPEEAPQLRELAVTRQECLEKIDEARFIMASAVSEESEQIVEASVFSCYEHIADEEELGTTCDSELIGWNMWDAISDEITYANFQDIGSICQSDMRKSNLEAVVDCDDDIKQVDFEITGPEDYFDDRTERQSLYFLYGNRDENVYNTNQRFSPGDYKVTATVVKKDGRSIIDTLLYRVADC